MIEALQDVDGACSMKRIGFAISAGIIVASWIANVFYAVTIDPNIIGAVTALGGLNAVGIAAERFGGRWGQTGDEG